MGGIGSEGEGGGDEGGLLEQGMAFRVLKEKEKG